MWNLNNLVQRSHFQGSCNQAPSGPPPSTGWSRNREPWLRDFPSLGLSEMKIDDVKQIAEVTP